MSGSRARRALSVEGWSTDANRAAGSRGQRRRDGHGGAGWVDTVGLSCRARRPHGDRLENYFTTRYWAGRVGLREAQLEIAHDWYCPWIKAGRQ